MTGLHPNPRESSVLHEQAEQPSKNRMNISISLGFTFCYLTWTVIPESRQAAVTLPTTNSRFARAFAAIIVTLSAVRSDSTVTRQASIARFEAVMVISAAITLVTLNVRQTVAGSDEVVAVIRSDVVATAILTILQPDGVSVESWRAQVTSSSERVVQAVNALARNAVA